MLPDVFNLLRIKQTSLLVEYNTRCPQKLNRTRVRRYSQAICLTYIFLRKVEAINK